MWLLDHEDQSRTRQFNPAFLCFFCRPRGGHSMGIVAVGRCPSTPEAALKLGPPPRSPQTKPEQSPGRQAG